MTKSSLVTGLLLALSVLSPGCGDSSEESYSYAYCFNCAGSDGKCSQDAASCSFGGCTTGTRTAESKDEYCSLLRNDGANNSCAREDRRRAFEQEDCAGGF